MPATMPYGVPAPMTIREKIQSVLDKTEPSSDSVRFNLFPRDAMTEEDAVFLGEKIKDLSVSSLEISCQTLNGTGLETVAPYFPKMENLTALDLNGNDGIGAGMGALAKALPRTKVRDLNLCGNTLYPSAGVLLAAALPSSGIRSLNLARNELGDEGTSALASRLSGSKLESLNLRKNGLSDKGCAELAAALPKSRVKELDLSINGIGSKGAAALADALPSSFVEKLSLADCDIGNDGIKALSKALPNSKIKELDLFNCGITDDGAKHLLVALQNPACRVSKINVNATERYVCGELDTSRLISPELKNMILKAVEKNKAREDERAKAKEEASNENAPETVKAAAKNVGTAKEAVENGMLIKAAYAGCLPEVVSSLAAKGQTPPAEAFLTPDENGCTPLSLVCEQKKLAELLTPENFKNAQDIQKLWNAVPPADKDQMDGKEGRPSFQKIKNAVMTNAVRSAMQAKKLQR